MILSDALKWAQEQLKGLSSPRLEAEILLAFCLKKSRTELISSAENELPHEKEVQFKQFVQERRAGKPSAYITKAKEFFGRTFSIDENVLIPRPETEELVEHAITYLHAQPNIHSIIDVGTGSGCIAVSIALAFPDRQVIGTDLSADALSIAFRNKTLHSCDNLELAQTNLMENIEQMIKDPQSPILILANLPYIGTKKHHAVDPQVDANEPHQALYSGPDGLDHYRELFEQVKKTPVPVQALFLEIGSTQGADISKEVLKHFPEAKEDILKDLAGLDRMAFIAFSKESTQ